MIKMLLLMAALLAPSLAYGGSTSTTLPDPQVTPAGPNPPPGIPCGIGPNYTGSIPAGAQAAGFTTCAFNLDFSNAQFATISNWLGNCGASSPIMYNTGYNSAATPCSDFNIVNDSGTNVLRITYTPADATAQSMASLMSTVNQCCGGPGNNQPGQTFPNGAYVQTTWRSTQATQDALFQLWQQLHNEFDEITFFSWSFDATHMEYDLAEAYVDGGATSAYHEWNGNGNSGGTRMFWPYNTNFSPSQEAVYHTYGMRVTADGTSIGYCSYLDSSQLSCSGFSPNSAIFASRTFWATGIGQLNNLPTNAPANNMDLFIKQITFFACPGWQTGQCNGTVLTGTP